jgi:transcriptional regulator with XRE-family HTH domain
MKQSEAEPTAVSRADQRDAFRHALRTAREAAELSQRAVARVLGLTPSAVWQWEEGRAVPQRATLVRLERLLELKPNALGRLLGYGPVDDSGTVASVVDAVQADPRLGAAERKMLLTFYDWLIRPRTKS